MRRLPTPKELLEKMAFEPVEVDNADAVVWEITLGDYYIEVWEQEDSSTAGLWVGSRWVGSHDSYRCITKQRAASKEEALERMIAWVGKWAESNPVPPEFEAWFFPYTKIPALSRLTREDPFIEGEKY